MDYDYISKQIAVYKTDKKLLELNCKLKLAPPDYYAHIHAEGDTNADGTRESSRIGLVLLDYSEGKDKKISAFVNISPAITDYIFSALQNRQASFSMQEEKILPNADAKTGRNKVTKLRIIRAEKNKDGQVRNYPWYVEIENGTAVAAKTAKGGTYAKKGSFTSESKVFINISDKDMYELFYTATHLIANWEAAYAPANIVESEIMLEQLLEAKKATG